MSIRYWVEICKPLSQTCLPDCLEEKEVAIEGIFNQSIYSSAGARLLKLLSGSWQPARFYWGARWSCVPHGRCSWSRCAHTGIVGFGRCQGAVAREIAPWQCHHLMSIMRFAMRANGVAREVALQSGSSQCL